MLGVLVVAAGMLLARGWLARICLGAPYCGWILPFWYG